MWEIWADYLLPKALKSCPKSNKLPNLVTLDDTVNNGQHLSWLFLFCDQSDDDGDDDYEDSTAVAKIVDVDTMC